ncbi:Oidioi.mRNA.OKI2018_I69.PAR.g10547.t1.cds [Oikopleura dioica]|uniref:Oidioi.mRNA.OKI2018_I69.PAR.g10547.t1.cds n=1 Tax=Oikopleura dioica TaxID=34765 RepID=A0ABN7RS10_OIKDI|nr:Oidioi.mRNA.OKI2018_I69.PAR.g10547.t1.cds [Oikopleura dioica]
MSDQGPQSNLPLLPGYSFSTTLGKEKFYKSHHFDVRHGDPMWVGDKKPGIGGVPINNPLFSTKLDECHKESF